MDFSHMTCVKKEMHVVGRSQWFFKIKLPSESCCKLNRRNVGHVFVSFF